MEPRTDPRARVGRIDDDVLYAGLICMREMGNVIEHLTQLSRGREITPEDILLHPAFEVRVRGDLFAASVTRYVRAGYR